MMVIFSMTMGMRMMEVLIMLMVMVVDNKYGDGWGVYSIMNEGKSYWGDVDPDHK